MVRLNPGPSSESPLGRLERSLAEGAVILLDGATGTELERPRAAMRSGVAHIDALANALARSEP